MSRPWSVPLPFILAALLTSSGVMRLPAWSQPATMTRAAAERMYAAALARGDYEHAIDALRTLLLLVPRSEKPRSQITIYQAMGDIYRTKQQDPDAAVAPYSRARDLAHRSGDRSAEARAADALGDSYRMLGGYAEAEQAFTRAADLHLALGDAREEASSALAAAKMQQIEGRTRLGLANATRSVSVANRIGDRKVEADALTIRGALASVLGRHVEASSALLRAGELHRSLDDPLVQDDEEQLALELRTLGRYDESLSWLRDALARARRAGDHTADARILAAIGVVYRTRGDASAARTSLTAARDIARSYNLSAEETAATADLGSLEWQTGHIDDAVDDLSFAYAHRFGLYPDGTTDPTELLASVAAMQQTFGWDRLADETLKRMRVDAGAVGEHPYEDLAADLVASDLSTSAGTYDAAVGFARHAVETARMTSSPPAEARALRALGVAELHRGDDRAAFESLTDARAIAGRIGEAPEEARSLRLLAEAEFRLGNVADGVRDGLAAATAARALSDRRLRWEALDLVGAAQLEHGHEKAALPLLDSALEEIESIRSDVRSRPWRMRYFRRWSREYDRYIDRFAEQDIRHPGRGYDRRAFDAFERKTARELLDDVGSSGARRLAGIPADVVATDRRTDAALNAARATEVSEDETPAQRTEYARKLAQAQMARDAFLAFVRSKYPAYDDFLHMRRKRPEQLQRDVLRPGELLLAYSVGETKSYLWVVDRDRFAMFALPGRSALDEGISRVLDHVAKLHREVARHALASALDQAASADIPAFADDASRLAHMLLPDAVRPVLAGASRTIIVPSPDLAAVPWEALVLGTDGDRSPRYLLEDTAISYAPSASVLGALRDGERNRHAAPLPLLAVAPSYRELPATPRPPMRLNELRREREARGVTATFVELPNAAREIEAVRTALEAPTGAPPKGSMLTGDSATRTALLHMDLRPYRYIVFAAHAVQSGQIPLLDQPAIILAHPELGHGFLTGADVFGLNLNADFVALSACGTASNEQSGEGVSDLASAFLHAGTPAVSVSLWDIDDASAPTLSASFFRGLQAGQRPAESLRNAKLALIRGTIPRLRHPYFWSSTIILGDGDLPVSK